VVRACLPLLGVRVQVLTSASLAGSRCRKAKASAAATIRHTENRSDRKRRTQAQSNARRLVAQQHETPTSTLQALPPDSGYNSGKRADDRKTRGLKYGAGSTAATDFWVPKGAVSSQMTSAKQSMEVPCTPSSGPSEQIGLLTADHRHRHRQLRSEASAKSPLRSSGSQSVGEMLLQAHSSVSPGPEPSIGAWNWKITRTHVQRPAVASDAWPSAKAFGFVTRTSLETLPAVKRVKRGKAPQQNVRTGNLYPLHALLCALHTSVS